MPTPEPNKLPRQPASPSQDWRYWWRLLRVFIILVVIAVIAIPATGGILAAWNLTHPPCADGQTTPDAYGSYQWEEFTVEASSGGRFDGFFIYGTNGATLIFPPAYRQDRGGRLGHAAALMKHGYAVVSYESRRCGEDMKPLSVGYLEADEVGDILEYLRLRGDVDMNRVGIHGFSGSGVTAIIAGARYPQLKAVIASGGYADMSDNLDSYGGDLSYLAGIYRFSMRQAYRVFSGISLEKLSPVDVIDEIAPRPILLIYGSTEPSLPGAYRQLEAAGDNAELWVVEGAGHGNYASVAPEEYERRTVEFFDRALLQTQNP